MTIPALVELLLIEDNPNDLELTLRALKRQKLADNVYCVKDGAEALDYIFQTGTFAGRTLTAPPKVVFIDLKLPKVTGIEVLRKIKSDDRTRNWPVVILTSSQQERDLIEAYQLGANSYVVKPVDYNEYATAIGNLGRYWLLLNQRPLH